MTYNILTWDNKQNICILQQDRGEGIIYAPAISNEKPLVGFDYDSFQYIEQADIYEVNGLPMSKEQKALCLAYIKSILPPIEWFNKVIINKPLQYLNSTDKWIIRKLETGKEIPDSISAKRAQARELDSLVKAADTLNKIEEARVLIQEILGDCDSCGNKNK